MNIILDPLCETPASAPEKTISAAAVAPETRQEPAVQTEERPARRASDAPAHRKKKRKGAFIALAAAVLLIGGILFTITHNWTERIVSYPSENPYITPYGSTLVSAHRSGGGIFPENTMMAFENCINAPDFRTDIFEFDLHITKDEALIILHDDTLDRTTDSAQVFGVSGARPEDYTLEELRRLNFGAGFTDRNGDRPFGDLHGEAVPENLRVATLTDVLDYLEENGGCRYVIEIKNKKELG